MIVEEVNKNMTEDKEMISTEITDEMMGLKRVKTDEITIADVENATYYNASLNMACYYDVLPNGNPRLFGDGRDDLLYTIDEWTQNLEYDTWELKEQIMNGDAPRIRYRGKLMMTHRIWKGWLQGDIPDNFQLTVKNVVRPGKIFYTEED